MPGIRKPRRFTLFTTCAFALVALLPALVPQALAGGFPWRYAAPPTAERRFEVDADWRPFGAVEMSLRSVEIRAEKSLSFSLFFQTKNDLWFEGVKELPLDGREHTFRWRLDDDSPDWRCANARRPFGRDALRWVRAWGVRVFSVTPVSGTLEVGDWRLLPAGGRRAPGLLEVRVAERAVEGVPCPVSFRLAGFDGNPYAPSEAGAMLSVRGPTEKVERPFYFRQEFTKVRHPGLDAEQVVPLGRPGWQADWRPTEPGTFELTIEARVAGHRISRRVGRVVVVPANAAPAVTAEDFTDPAVRTEPVGTNGLNELFVWTGRDWAHAAGRAGALGYWSTRLDWTPRWGHYTGLGEFEQRMAWEFEQQVKSCPKAKARPLMLFSQDELDETGSINWADHPINQRNGGTADRPSGVFADGRMTDAVVARARYLWARFGDQAGVSGLLMQLDWPEDAPVAWVRRVAETVARDLPAGALFCTNPELPLRLHEEALDLVRDWLQDTRLGSPTVFQRDVAGQAIAVESAGGNAMAIVARRTLHWAGRGAFSCDVEGARGGALPESATCLIRTAPGMVFESLPILLRADERTRLNFRLDVPGNWVCRTDADRALTAYDLLNVQELGLRFFSSRVGPLAARVGRCVIRGPYRMDADVLSPLTVRNARLMRERVPRHERIEVAFELSRVYSNPFDPAEVDVWGVLTRPDGTVVKSPGFYFQDYSRGLVDGREELSLVGTGGWRVRFCGTEVGRQECRVEVRDKQGGVASQVVGSVEVVPSPVSGMVRIHRKDARFLERDDGVFFYPIGHNICHPVDTQEPYPYAFTKPVNQQTYTFDRYLTRMSEAGENWGRIWLVPWGLGIEGPAQWGEFHGVGRYSMENAWRLDHVLETAAGKGILLNLTLDHYSEFSQSWRHNAYNQERGGVLANAAEFFPDSRAQELYRRRLRYQLARWGYSPNIMAWELWGEVNLMPGYERRSAFVARWHRDTARFIRNLDHGAHLVFSHCHNWQRGGYLWELPEIQCVQGNGYIRPPNVSVSHVINFRRYIDEVAGYRKPVFVAEYGGKSEQGAVSADYLEAQLHSGLWSSLMYPFAGAAMHWWWNFIEGEDMYRHYRGFSAFCRGLDKTAGDYRTIEPAVMHPGGSGLKAVGISSGRDCFLWIYHPDIFTRYANLPAVEGATLLMPPLNDGLYQLEFWDTLEGKVLARENWTPAERPAIALPKITRDMAIRVTPNSKSAK